MSTALHTAFAASAAVPARPHATPTGTRPVSWPAAYSVSYCTRELGSATEFGQNPTNGDVTADEMKRITPGVLGGLT
ncbi:MAG: hypothetical protein AAFP84_00430 [Actinomycetota bacterium]